MQVNIPAALGILRRHYNRIDTTKALALLPLSTKVSDIHAFLTAVMRERFAQRREGQVLMNLLKAERLQVRCTCVSRACVKDTTPPDHAP